MAHTYKAFNILARKKINREQTDLLSCLVSVAVPPPAASAAKAPAASSALALITVGEGRVISDPSRSVSPASRHVDADGSPVR